jgi:hypothetical protein
MEERRRERDARRDYEYEARKRLYSECGPLLLQLVELSESAYRRVASLARTAAQGDLPADGRGWLADPKGYYYLSTAYWLLAPLAVVKLLQRRLTLLDFSLDRRIFTQYSLAKELYDSFAGDFRLARLEPALAYRPEVADAEQKKHERPQEYAKQGMYRGLVDIAAEALIVNDPASGPRLRSFGEFEEDSLNEATPVRKALKRMEYLLVNFHPATRPVFWRILVAQAHIYLALLQTRAGADEGVAAVPSIPARERQAFDWRQQGENVGDQAVLVEPFAAAEGYLRERLNYLLEGKASPSVT